MKYRDIRKRLKNDDFEKTRHEGSHEQWEKPPDKRVTVAGHDGDDVPTGTKKSIFKQAGWR